MPGKDFYARELDAIPTHAHRESVGGIGTAWWNYGPTTGPIDLVLVHGFRGDHHGLEPFVAKLGRHLRIVIPDLPGFGDTDALEPAPVGESRIRPYALWLREFLHSVGADKRTTVLGHSFGSIVVSAAFHEGLAQDRCILVNPIATNALRGPRGIMTRLAVLYYQASAMLPERAGQALLRNRAIVRIMSATMAKTRDRDLRRWIHGQHDSYFSSFTTRDSVLEAFKASVEHDVSEFASTLPPHTMLIVADRDDITALPKQRELAARLTKARLEVVPNVGHLVHYEAPEFAALVIADFLATRGRR
jgi:pimeloyl-ACP methyl ester carboxylesterase